MFDLLKKAIKAILPNSLLKKIRPIGHGFLALWAAFANGYPSEKLVVIGITGTAGKSTTAKMLAHILNANGKKAGYITTISFFDGEKEFVNEHGMSMPGGPLLQKQLKQMVDRGCQFAVIETTSEGLAQNRHLGINFDMALFTNLTPAHLDNHQGSFEIYKQSKARLFKAFGKKKISNPNFSKKAIGVNLDDDSAEFYLSFPADLKFGISSAAGEGNRKVYVLGGVVQEAGAVKFAVNNQSFAVNLVGKFNAWNAGLAAAAADVLGVNLEKSFAALAGFKQVQGRMQSIENNRGIQIFVDYAPEPAEMRQVLETVQDLPHQKIIHVFGSTGGHRDVAKRFEFGKLSAMFSDVIIITNDDVYESDPEKIAADIEQGISQQEKKKVQSVLKVLDRQDAIKKALDIAGQGDIVIITGKGSERFLVLPGNKRIKWNEPELVRELLK